VIGIFATVSTPFSNKTTIVWMLRSGYFSLYPDIGYA